MNRRSVVALTVAVCLGYVAMASAQTPEIPCLIGGFSQLPVNTKLALGPTVHWAATNILPIANAIVGAWDAWDASLAQYDIENANSVYPP